MRTKNVIEDNFCRFVQLKPALKLKSFLELIKYLKVEQIKHEFEKIEYTCVDINK